MSALLDTHIFVWWVTEPGKLTVQQAATVENRSEPAFVSAVTGWEVAIKVKLGKWPEAAPLLPNLAGLVLRSGLQVLDLSLAQAERAGSLPLIHRDPFDRLLAAQAIDQGLTLLTLDPAFKLLGCRVA